MGVEITFKPMEDGDNPHPYIGHHRGQANDKPMEDGDKPHPYIGEGRLLSPRLHLLVFFLSQSRKGRKEVFTASEGKYKRM